MNQKMTIVNCEERWNILIGTSYSNIATEDKIKDMGITDVIIESCGEGNILETMFSFKLDKQLTTLDKLIKKIQFIVKEKKD